MSNRYSLSFRTRTLIPTVEVRVPSVVSLNPYHTRYDVEHVCRGFTDTHAYRRALRWTRKHGDTR